MDNKKWGNKGQVKTVNLKRNAIIKTTKKSCPGLPPVVMTCPRRSVVKAQLNHN